MRFQHMRKTVETTFLAFSRLLWSFTITKTFPILAILAILAYPGPA